GPTWCATGTPRQREDPDANVEADGASGGVANHGDRIVASPPAAGVPDHDPVRRRVPRACPRPGLKCSETERKCERLRSTGNRMPIVAQCSVVFAQGMVSVSVRSTVTD